MRERWAGESQLKDGIDSALRAYFEGWQEYARSDPEAEDWEDNGDIPVGWVCIIQTLGHNDEMNDDADGIVEVIAPGTSRYSALGLVTSMKSWLEDD